VVPAGGRETELGVKGRHSEDLVLRDLEPAGDAPDGLRPQVTLDVLHPLQDGDQVAPLALELPPQIGQAAFGYRIASLHLKPRSGSLPRDETSGGRCYLTPSS